MEIKAVIHYTRKDGLPTWATGAMTTNHPASSHGLPVWVSSEYPNARTTDIIRPNTPYGPADLPAGYDVGGYFGSEIKELIQDSGYRLGPSAL